MAQGPVYLPFCKTLGCPGECEDVDRCICVCFALSAKKVGVTTAYFGELGEVTSPGSLPVFLVSCHSHCLGDSCPSERHQTHGQLVQATS